MRDELLNKGLNVFAWWLVLVAGIAVGTCLGMIAFENVAEHQVRQEISSIMPTP
jgi:hypothetical protein